VVCVHRRPKEMDAIARLKPIGGQQQVSYIPTNENQVFAVLSFRLSLDACLHNSKVIPLIRTAVNSYMRVVISMDEETGIMHTITPSDPILAKAAMDILCTGYNWAISIDTLVRNLLEKGLVEKGLKGELYARLLLILAQDWIRLRRGQVLPDESDGLNFIKSFTVRDFLKTLYAKNYHKLLT
jgi:hypothetical protein